MTEQTAEFEFCDTYTSYVFNLQQVAPIILTGISERIQDN